MQSNFIETNRYLGLWVCPTQYWGCNYTFKDLKLVHLKLEFHWAPTVILFPKKKKRMPCYLLWKLTRVVNDGSKAHKARPGGSQRSAPGAVTLWPRLIPILTVGKAWRRHGASWAWNPDVGWLRIQPVSTSGTEAGNHRQHVQGFCQCLAL